MDNPQTQPSHVDPELKQRLAALYAHMAKRLKIQQAPKIIFTQNAENAKKPFGLTAYYDQKKRSIRVYVTGRHPTDILRSFAHELIHHWQNEHGALPPEQGGHAHYAQKNPVLRQREMEAYLIGNILFRDWQDEQRYGALNENVQKADLKRVIKELVFEAIVKSTNKTDAPVIEELISRRDLKAFIKERIQMSETWQSYKLSQQPNEDDVDDWNEWHPDNPVRTVNDLIKAREKEKLNKKWGKSTKGGKPAKDKFDLSLNKSNRQQNYAQWLKTMLARRRDQDKKAEKYYQIGFAPGNNHYCWYWNPGTKQIVAARGGAHMEHFGKEIPYKNFRGRYDLTTKELSLAVPEFGKMNITGDMKKDVPPELFNALNKTFNHPKIFYFPFVV